MSDIVQETRQHIAEIGQLLFDRHLADAAGGNISARAGDLLCITPRYSGSKHKWHLLPHEVLVVDSEGKKIEGNEEISREAKVHLKLMKSFPEGTAIIHAHPRNVMVFATIKQPIYPIMEGTLKFGVVKVSKYAPAHSTKLADFISMEFSGQTEMIRKQAAAVIAPWHGLFVIGKDLDAAFDAVERIDTNAYCILMSRLFPGMENRRQEQIFAELLQDYQSNKE
jgi:L-fuculose-phosphate aldolase